MTLFSGDSLTCIRGGRLVFRDLSFSLGAGEALVLVGPNGSGKSSLLRLMAGLIEPFAGTLVHDGIAVADDPEAHYARTAYLGHVDAIKAFLSIREDLAFWRTLRGSPVEPETAIAAFGLEAQAALPGRYLSSGQRRRAALARLLVSDAALWLLDEPSVGLDSASIARLGEVMAAHRAAGGSIVAATHLELGLDGARTLNLADHAVAPAEAVAAGAFW